MARTEPFNRVWANDPSDPGDPSSFSTPSNERIDLGWEGGLDKDAPQAGEQNWWQNKVESALQDIERYGSMAWNTNSIYAVGAPCYFTDGNFYESIIASNTGNPPPTSPSAWRVIGLSLYGAFQPGDSKMVWHNGVPDAGWLKCNGAVVLRSLYPRLFNKIGTTFNTGGELATQFRLPDARGVFVRGFDDGRGFDPGRSMGSYQADALGAHNHISGNPVVGGAYGAINTGFPLLYLDATNPGSLYPYTSTTGASETRPKNITAVYWIRY